MARRGLTRYLHGGLPLVWVLLVLGGPGCAKRLPPLDRPALPPAVSDLLADLPFAVARPIPHAHLAGAERILRLPDGTLYIRAGMQIDADGSPNARSLDPLHGRLATSLVYPGTGGTGHVDAEQVPYLVLPEGFFTPHGIQLGDLAAVVYRGRVAFAIFADVGPPDRIGEGSIRLAEELGHAPWRSWTAGENLSSHGGISSREVEYLVFPGSRPETLAASTIVRRIREEAGKRYRALGGKTAGRAGNVVPNR